MTPQSRRKSKGGSTRIIFLGGADEIGRSMTLFEHERKILIMDVGLMFPTEEMLGVDLVLPDFDYLRGREEDIVGVMLTHGHEDHIGGVAYLLKEMSVPIYGSRLTIGLLRPKLEEHRLAEEARLNEVQVPGTLKLGPFTLTFSPMAHSIPDAVGTLIETSAGKILFTGDFKIDRDLDGKPSGMAALTKVGRAGVDLLISDSTNADRAGETASEASVGEVLTEVIGKAQGRVIVACFASNIHRVQQIADAAEKNGRFVAFLGRSMLANVRVTRELDYLHVPDSMIIPIDESNQYPDEKVVVISTGSQGEPLSALSLMAAREHKWIKLTPGDTVILSATPIPGNESAVRRVIDGLFRIGVSVIAPPTHGVHVSGHAAAGDLRMLAELIAPNWFVPVHGEYRQLAMHKAIAQEAGIPEDRILLVESGDVLQLDKHGVRKVERVPAGYVYVDGLGIGDVGDVVLRDRRLLADDGVIVCVVTIDSQSGALLAGPDIISRGFVYEDEAKEFLSEARAEIRESLAGLAQDEITDWDAVRRAVRRSLGKFVWNETRRRPIILPVVMEV